MEWLTRALAHDVNMFILFLSFAIPIGGFSGIISGLKGKGFWYGFWWGFFLLFLGIIIVAVEDSEKS